MGEIAAATTAGALSLRDGAAVVCRRSLLVGTLDQPGAMVAVRLGERESIKAIGGLADRVSVAVVNGPHSTVLAGDPEALAEIVALLEARGVLCRPIRAGYASHSPFVEPLHTELLRVLADLRPRTGQVPMHSTTLGRVVPGDALDAEYWMANLREPVRFSAAVADTLQLGSTLFIEISPHPLLVPAIEDVVEECRSASVAVPSLLRDQPEWESLLTSLGTVYTHGGTPDWTKLHDDDGRFVPLPSYPWRRRRFWVDTPELVVVRPTSGVEDRRRYPATGSAAALTERLAHCAAMTLGARPDSIDPAVPLTMAGMDSLLAARLRTTIEDDLDLRVSITDLLGDRPLTELATRLCASG
jgi:acyl transferase domain-containing protein